MVSFTPIQMLSAEFVANAIKQSAGHDVLDKWGMIDSARAERQIEAWSGQNTFHATGPKDRGLNDPTWAPDAFSAAIGSVPITGSVAFMDGATTLGTVTLAANGTASFSTSSLAAGSHNITAQYSGDANYLPATSNTVVQVVNVPWTPSQLSGLIAWWKADAGTWSDTGGTTPAANGQQVLRWSDNTASNVYLYNSVAGPVLVSPGLNGLPILRCDGSDRHLHPNNTLPQGGASTLSIFTVIKPSSSNTASQALLSLIGPVQTDDYNNALSLTFAFSVPTCTVARNSIYDQVTLSFDAWMEFAAVFDGANCTSYVNNVAQAPAVSSSGAFGATEDVYMFARYYSSALQNFFIGDVAEVLIKNTPVTGTDLTNIHNYFSGKWGV